MEYIRELRSRVEWTIPSHVLKVGELFSVRIDKLRQILLQKLDTVRQNMLNQFSKELGQQCAKCLRRYGPAVQHMRSAAENFDEYAVVALAPFVLVVSKPRRCSHFLLCAGMKLCRSVLPSSLKN